MGEQSGRPGAGHRATRDGQGPAEDVAAEVARRLARYRSELLGGRGPGASEDELARHMSYRPTVGGLPTAVSRELLHQRTERARGADPSVLRWERDWSRPSIGPSARATTYHGPQRAEELQVVPTARGGTHRHDGLLRRLGQLLVLAGIRRLHHAPPGQLPDQPSRDPSDRAHR